MNQFLVEQGTQKFIQPNNTKSDFALLLNASVSSGIDCFVSAQLVSFAALISYPNPIDQLLCTCCSILVEHVYTRLI